MPSLDCTIDPSVTATIILSYFGCYQYLKAEARRPQQTSCTCIFDQIESIATLLIRQSLGRRNRTGMVLSVNSGRGPTWLFAAGDHEKGCERTEGEQEEYDDGPVVHS